MDPKQLKVHMDHPFLSLLPDANVNLGLATRMSNKYSQWIYAILEQKIKNIPEEKIEKINPPGWGGEGGGWQQDHL